MSRSPGGKATPPEGPSGGDTPVSDLAGIGPKRTTALRKLGVRVLRDLWTFVPSGLEEWPEPVSIAEARERIEAGTRWNERVTLEGRALRWSLWRRGRGRSLLTLVLGEGDGEGPQELDIQFFNQPWIRPNLEAGMRVQVHGPLVQGQRPALRAMRSALGENSLPEPGTLRSIYPSGGGLSQDRIRDICGQALEVGEGEREEWLSTETLEAHGMTPFPEAVRELHRPTSRRSFEGAIKRVRLEPWLEMQRKIRGRALSKRRKGSPIPADRALHEELCGHFPFTWTPGQVQVAREICADLGSGRVMRRLLQGDVGSGKTAVGIYACMLAARSGGQAAFLAPTELLAEQHAAGERERLAAAGFRSLCITGSLAASERRDRWRAVADGDIEVVFGTHALFSGRGEFADLRLAVIDEQHRFGVAQRRALLAKGRDVHALLMTATPIPRSLALTLYGDLSVSTLREKPPGRGEVTTHWVRGKKRSAILPYLTERLERGEQVYWVCPRIGGAEEDEDPRTAEARFAKLSKLSVARFGIELVHGKLSTEERSARLQRFRTGEARFLVATTVVEVGVDVPRATCMVIEAAERLGLAQLHQLRGRIGRSKLGGRCLILGEAVAEERFRVLERCHDGFELAEEDLRQRGMGDLLGLRQSGPGGAGTLDAEVDLELLSLARDLAEREALGVS